jgi:hypothetical protein
LEVSLATPECITAEFQCRCLHALTEVRRLSRKSTKIRAV